MNPLIRFRVRALACALPLLVLSFARPAKAETGYFAVPASATSAVSPNDAQASFRPANYVFLDTPSSLEGTPAAADESSSTNALPDAPQPLAHSPAAPDGARMVDSSTGGTAPKYALTIPSGWTAQQISAGDKMVIGLRNLYSPITFAGIILSAGYSHLTDGQPNYGVDGTAFGKRFGAGVARSSSQDVFTNVVLAPLFREDPRYYVLGPRAGFFHRVVYAATRPLITRTDSGRNTVNAALLIGYAGAAALTPTYYPPINRNFHDVAATYGASLGGAAIGFGFSEFADQLFKAIHLKH